MFKHRRSIITDQTGAGFDVQNNARCTSFGSKRMCASNCPRHNAATYADQYARHATDSIGNVESLEVRMAAFNNYGVTR